MPEDGPFLGDGLHSGSQQFGTRQGVDAQVVPVTAVNRVVFLPERFKFGRAQIQIWIMNAGNCARGIILMRNHQLTARGSQIGQVHIVGETGLNHRVGLVEADVGIHHHQEIAIRRAKRAIPAAADEEIRQGGVVQLQDQVALIQDFHHQRRKLFQWNTARQHFLDQRSGDLVDESFVVPGTRSQIFGGGSLLGAHKSDHIICVNKMRFPLQFHRPGDTQDFDQRMLVESDHAIHGVVVGVGIQIFGIQRGGAIVREPVGIPEDQHRAVHILLELPGGDGIGTFPVVQVA